MVPAWSICSFVMLGAAEASAVCAEPTEGIATSMRLASAALPKSFAGVNKAWVICLS